MIDAYHLYYQENTEDPQSMDEYQSSDAIQWFMKYSFLRKTINKALQTENTNQLYALRYFLNDLVKSFSQKHIQSNEEKLTLYQEIKLSEDEFTQLQENKGKLIAMKEFLITTTDRSAVLPLLTLSSNQSDFISVLFEIGCNLTELDENFIINDVTQFNESAFPQTILFDFDTTFRLDDIQQDEQIWVIKLTVVTDGRSIIQKYIQDTHRQMENLSVPIIFGKLLYDMYQWNQSQIYFEHLLNDSPNEDVAWIELCLGQCHQ